jgi:hypothetical protein
MAAFCVMVPFSGATFDLYLMIEGATSVLPRKYIAFWVQETGAQVIHQNIGVGGARTARNTSSKKYSSLREERYKSDSIISVIK